MPIHDWTLVEAGIFHQFHHSWIEEIKRALNRGVLSSEYYALIEHHPAGCAEDEPKFVLRTEQHDRGAGTLVSRSLPLSTTAETEDEFYRRKQDAVTVRHVSDDRVIAMIEIVSPGNKNSRINLLKFVEKSAWHLDNGIQLLVLDLLPPGRRDPQGIHSEIWEYISGTTYVPPAGKPLTLAAYESRLSVRAYVHNVAVGDTMIDMPLFLDESKIVPVPLEATYLSAFAAVPRRWRRVLDPHAG